MKRSKIFIISLLVIMFSFSASAQDDPKPTSVFTLGAEISPRTEYYHGYKTLALEDEKMKLNTAQRSRLVLNYKSEKIVSKLVLQDVRDWGNQKQLVKNEAASVSVHEAWGEMFLTKNLSFKAGRMEIVYDDHRIFGSVGWAHQARSHDAAILKFTNKKMHFHLGGAYYNDNNFNDNEASFNSYRYYDGPNAYKAIQFAHFNYNSKPFNISVLFLNNGKSENEYSVIYDDVNEEVLGTERVAQNVAYSQTIGARLQYKNNGLTFIAGGYYQMGVNPSSWATAVDADDKELSLEDTFFEDRGYETDKGMGQKIGAYQFNVEAGYKAGPVYAALGVEMLSGNSYEMDANNTSATYGSVSDTDENQSAFTPFYGTNHKFNGWMDYFYVGNHTGNVGLTDIYAKLILKQDKFFVKLIPHYFMTAGSGSYSTATVDADGFETGDYIETVFDGGLGTEIDLWCGYNVAKGACIQVGYSHLIATDSMKALKTGSIDTEISGSQNWAWIMFVYKPTFFKHETFKK